jgi:ribose 5-phosphate isomerase A
MLDARCLMLDINDVDPYFISNKLGRNTKPMVTQNELKEKAAWRAVEFIESGMVVGLGTGSTASFAVVRIAELLKNGKLQNIVGIPSSIQTEKMAKDLNIPLTTFDDHPEIDLTIDGADEVDPELNLIKGGGGALLREKILSQASRRNIIIVDESKLSDQLGKTWAVPVEIIPFARETEDRYLKNLGATVQLRKNDTGEGFRTDQGNLILDADFGPIAELQALAIKLNDRAGIVEHGLFLKLATDVIVAGEKDIRHLRH